MKNEDKKEVISTPSPIMRQIIIETDGNNIHVIKAEVSGRIEFTGILQNLITYLNQPNGTENKSK